MSAVIVFVQTKYNISSVIKNESVKFLLSKTTIVRNNKEPEIHQSRAYNQNMLAMSVMLVLDHV